MLDLKDPGQLREAALVGTRWIECDDDFMELKYLCMGGIESTEGD